MRSPDCIGRCAASESRRTTVFCLQEEEGSGGRGRGERREYKSPARKKRLTIDGDVSHVWNHDHCWSSFRSYVCMCMRTHRGELTRYINWEWIGYSQVGCLSNAYTRSIGATETNVACIKCERYSVYTAVFSINFRINNSWLREIWVIDKNQWVSHSSNFFNIKS